MSDKQVAEVCVDPTTHQAAVMRRRDGRCWLSRDATTARELGAAIVAALQPGDAAAFGADVCLSEVGFLQASGYTLVVSRREHAVHIGAPSGTLDAPSEIVLGDQPTSDELGAAVLAFVRRDSERRSPPRRSPE